MFCYHSLLNFLILILTAHLILIQVQSQSQSQSQSSNSNPSKSRSVNIFIINDEENVIANKSISSALKELKENSPGLVGNVITVEINGSDSNSSLTQICKNWDDAVRDGGPGVPDFVLDTTTSGFGSEIVNSFTRAVGVPTLSAQFGQEGDLRFWRDLNDSEKKYLIQIMPPADLIPEIIRSLVSDMNISNAAIIYDNEFVMDHKYKSLLLNVPTRHVIIKNKIQADDINKQLNQLRDLDLVNFFILGNDKVINDNLIAGDKRNFTGKKYGWYVLTMDDDFKIKCDCKNLTVISFKPKFINNNNNEMINDNLLSKPYITSAFYYDLTIIGIKSMKQSINDNTWPDEPQYITCNEYNKNNTPVKDFDFLSKLKTFNQGYKPIFSSFYFGDKNGQHRADFTMDMEMNYITDGIVGNIVPLGTWQAAINSPINIEAEQRDKVINHTAVTSFRVVTVIVPPFIMYDKETDTWSGYCIDLIEKIREILGFEYEIYEVSDKLFGTMNKQGEWDGMIKELKEKRADIALGTLSVMAERENVVDFTVPYYDLVGISILMLKPKQSTSLFKFLTVLENDVWLCILASYLFTSFLMWVFDRWSPYSYQNNKEKYKDDEEKREFDLRECLWFCMTSLTPQGGGEAPKNLSGRLVAATWWLFGFIIIASYTANLAAFLTVSRLETPIESLDDLSKQYKVQYAPKNPSDAYTYFERMSNIENRFYEIWKDMSLNDSLSEVERAQLAVWDYPVSDRYTKMFQAMKEANFPTSLEEAVMRVRQILPNTSNTDFAYIGDATDIRYLAMTNCDLLMIGDEFSRKPYAIAVQQGSPLKDQFNNAILQLLNKRELERLKNKWWTNNPNKRICTKEDDQSEGISIKNIGGVFIVIFVGIGLACCTLAFEYWYYRYRPMMEQQNRNKFNKASPINVKPIRLNLKPAKSSQFSDNSNIRARF